MLRMAARSTDQASSLAVRLIEGAWLSKAVYVIVQLRIPDLLADAPKHSEELAAATRTNARALHRLLRALAAEGVFAIDVDDRFSLTPVGTTLRSNVAGSLHDWALLMLGDIHQGAWRELLHSVETGQCAFSHRYGDDLWTYGSKNPAYANLFNAAMAGFTKTYVESLLSAYSFTAFRTIVDVGGGDGGLLIRILDANPAIRGHLFDLPHVAKQAQHRIKDADLSERCIASGGDFFAEVPAGGDAYILSRVLHDWADDEARRILKSCRKAMLNRGRLLIIERLVPEGFEISSAPGLGVSDICLTDLNMLVMTTGRERTMKEYRQLLEPAGLQVIGVTPTNTPMNVIEVVSSPAPTEQQ